MNQYIQYTYVRELSSIVTWYFLHAITVLINIGTIFQWCLMRNFCSRKATSQCVWLYIVKWLRSLRIFPSFIFILKWFSFSFFFKKKTNLAFVVFVDFTHDHHNASLYFFAFELWITDHNQFETIFIKPRWSIVYYRQVLLQRDITCHKVKRDFYRQLLPFVLMFSFLYFKSLLLRLIFYPNSVKFINCSFQELTNVHVCSKQPLTFYRKTAKGGNKIKWKAPGQICWLYISR
jgi:hypothetical protein